jgi:MSHA biogenesis protein MshK
MADRLKRPPGAGLFAGLLCSAALAGSPAALAQNAFADPTRPPPAVAAAAAESSDAGGPVLQSVLVPQKGKPIAVISGQSVRLGELYETYRLVELSEREAVLAGADGEVRLTLTPGVEKINVATRAADRKRGEREAGRKP